MIKFDQRFDEQLKTQCITLFKTGVSTIILHFHNPIFLSVTYYNTPTIRIQHFYHH